MQISRSFRFDWKDGFLVALGFAILVLLLMFLNGPLGLDLGKGLVRVLVLPAILGPLFVRRALFGQPQLGNIRNGILFRLLSIVGLVLIFLGFGAGALTMVSISRALDPKPNFEAEERAIYTHTTDFDFGPANESPDARERRQQEDQARLEQQIKKGAAEREKEWLVAEAERNRLRWLVGLATIAFMAIGSFFLSLRYEKLDPESSAPNSST